MDTRRPVAPVIPPVPIDRIPQELRDRPQWVAWRYERRRAKWTKVPVNPHTGRNADPADPATWGTFAQARAHARRQQLGLGYVFAADDPYVGIDLDQCRDPATGALTARASSIVAEVDTFAEISVSGTGVHLIARGALPGLRRKSPALAIEMYQERRFFAVTGRHLPDSPCTIEPRQETLAWLYGATFGPDAAAAVPAAPYLMPDLDDAAVLERARNARNGAKFAALWGGDTGAHGGDHSAADLALLSELAFWTGGDTARMDRLFRQSALYRPKWDERRGAVTYGERTIARALQRSTFYQSPPSSAAPPSAVAEPPSAPGDEAAAGGPDPENLDAATREELHALLRTEQRRRQAAEAERDALRGELAAIRRQCRELGRLHSGTMAVLRNPHLKAERVTALAVAFDTASEERRGRMRDDGYTRLPRARLAASAGCSEKRVSAHLDRLAEWGIIEKKVEQGLVRHIDPETGEATNHYQSEIYVKRNGAVVDVLTKLATLEPAKPETWGGKRLPACPNHPEAGTVKRWMVACATCGQVLDQGEQYRTATGVRTSPTSGPHGTTKGPGDWRTVMAEPAPGEQDDHPTPPAPTVGDATDNRDEPTVDRPSPLFPPSMPGEHLDPLTDPSGAAKTPSEGAAKPCFNVSRGCTQQFVPIGRWELYCPDCHAAGWHNPRPPGQAPAAGVSPRAYQGKRSPQQER